MPGANCARALPPAAAAWRRGSIFRPGNSPPEQSTREPIDGIVEYAINEDEVAMVIAHEIGHQAADHVATGQRNQQVGALVGAVLLGAPGAAASYKSGVNVTNSAMQTGANLGAKVGRISYSKEQEREADYLAALILSRSGIDPANARGFLARASGRKETGMLDSHPAGPERVAGWDQAVAEIRATNGRLPQRA